MPDVLTTAKSVVDALGGVSTVAGIFGVGQTAVLNWVSWNRFPARTYLVLKRRLREKGTDAPDSLWAMASEAEASEVAA